MALADRFIHKIGIRPCCPAAWRTYLAAKPYPPGCLMQTGSHKLPPAIDEPTHDPQPSLLLLDRRVNSQFRQETAKCSQQRDLSQLHRRVHRCQSRLSDVKHGHVQAESSVELKTSSWLGMLFAASSLSFLFVPVEHPR